MNRNQNSKKTIYTCPMHPEIIKEMAGMCPECGMNLIKHETHDMNHARRDKQGSHTTQMFLRKFWVSLILSIFVLAYSDTVQELLRFEAPLFKGSFYIPFIVSSVIFFYGGWIFLRSAFRELKAKLPGMMTLIALAISIAYTWSIYVILKGGKETLFWELSTLITVMLLGHYLEIKAVSSAQAALKELSKLLPDKAEVIRNGKTEFLLLEEVKVGDLVLVKPGGKIPTDGQVLEGSSDVNESIVSGESKPVLKQQNSEVIAGSINGDGSLKIKVTKIGEETFLAGVMRLVEIAQASKSRLQMLSDKAAYYLTIIAVVMGSITFISWLAIAKNASFAIERMVAVLVIACPHALGLAIPLVASISTQKAAKNGFLVKQRLALEAARNIDVVLFDKTGTLTEAKFGVLSYSSKETLALAASVNVHSEHPIALGIVEEAKKRGLPLKELKNFKRIPGIGAEGEIENQKVFVGHRGEADILVEVNGEKIGSIKVADKIRSEAKEAILQLKNMGLKLAMITGDSEEVAKEVSKELGIDEYFARVLPGEKSEKVKLLQNKGQKVAMVGDGVNDAPSLMQADLGIAIGAGTNVAIESAGIILVRNDPRDIPKIIKLSRLTFTKMIQNLFWATGYNIFAIPLAAGVLASKGILLQPALAAIFMSFSTVIVAFNALLLRKQKI
ncbi:MAG: copper-translocating P-type ATPase [Patescibacteria group bacterium]